MAAKTILVVDDDKDLVKSIKAFLEARGYEVVEAGSGKEAEAKLQVKRPDAVVLDIMMDHDADGFNLAFKLNADEATRRIPIIIVSGYEQHLSEKYKSFEFVQGRDWPAAKFFQKPVNLKELADSIGNLIKEAQAREESLA